MKENNEFNFQVTRSIEARSSTEVRPSFLRRVRLSAEERQQKCWWPLLLCSLYATSPYIYSAYSGKIALKKCLKLHSSSSA